MHAPKFPLAGSLGRAGQLFGGASEEVATLFVLQRPSARVVVGDTDLEAAAGVTILRLAQHIAKRVHRQVSAQVRLQVDYACDSDGREQWKRIKENRSVSGNLALALQQAQQDNWWRNFISYVFSHFRLSLEIRSYPQESNSS